jgi:hypothetical protein
MGWLEKIIVTPSHHRVHHALNPEYLDKNYGQIFIFWDKWFGTFQEELPNVKPVYGITRPVRTWNPIKINFTHIALLIKDAWHTKNIIDKIRIWFMPTGWRPSDVSIKYPIYKIDDPYHFQKYDTINNKWLTVWTWIQISILLLFISYLFGNIASIGSPGMFYYGAFIFLYVYAFTDLMDEHANAWIWELSKSILGFILMYITKDWFGIGNIWSVLPYMIAAYFVISPIIVFQLAKANFKKISIA